MGQIDEPLWRPRLVSALSGACVAWLLAGGCGSVAPRSGTDVGAGAGAGGAFNGRGAAGGSIAGNGAGGAAGGAAPGSGDGVVVGGARPPCLAVPSEGVFIGDSYITGFLSPPLQPTLAALDPFVAGFRNHAVAGTAMASGGLGTIPPQFDTTLAEDARVKLVIMDGGGNDFLICDPIRYPRCTTLCSAPGSATQRVCTDIVAAAVAAMGQLAAKMADAGVKDIVYFFYPHIPNHNGGFREIVDYSEPLVRQQCQDVSTITGGRLTCHFVDLTGPFQAAGGDLNPANFSPIDGIHPSAAGQVIIASQIWSTMQRGCLGQTAASGCCVP
jgi:lysophospholipase L1-like esterase